jgi:hypothetical protein
MDNRAKTIQIFLPDGSPRGIKIAEITSRIVKAIMIPRNRLHDAGTREDIKAVGIYFLFGQNEDEAKPTVYIGEAEDVYHRLKQHNKEKDWWDTALAVVTSNNTFTKSHIKYLEWFCFDQCKQINRYHMQQTVPTKSYIPETVLADLMDIFDTMKVLLSTLGYHLFDQMRSISSRMVEAPEVTPEPITDDIFYCKSKGIEAQGMYGDEGFILFQHSQMVMIPSPSLKTYAELRERLVQDQIVIEQDGVYIFQSDYVFRSPSAACSVVLGRSSNGWTDWKTKDGKTLDEVKRKNV